MDVSGVYPSAEVAECTFPAFVECVGSPRDLSLQPYLLAAAAAAGGSGVGETLTLRTREERIIQIKAVFCLVLFLHRDSQFLSKHTSHTI